MLGDRFFAALIVAFALVASSLSPARAEIGAYLLFEMDSGEVIAAHEATTPWYPASLTKLMTAHVTFQAVREGELRLTSPVKISVQARQQPPSRLGLPVGTVLTVEAALRIILTKSANDVSVALAQAVGGTLSGFVERMNDTAAQLGMDATSFDNPHGLPNRAQITTARDVAILMMALARDFPDRADFFTMDGVRLGGRTMPNYNVLIRRLRGADGMKTGFICSSGFNLAASATRDGVRLGAVVLGGLTSRERDERTAELLVKGFEAWTTDGQITLDGFADGDRLSRMPVAGTRPERGTVADLDNLERSPVDRRTEVCGARRPVTRYSDGTVASLAEVEEQARRRTAHQNAVERLAKLRVEALAAPRAEPPVVRENASEEERATPLGREHDRSTLIGPAEDTPAGRAGGRTDALLERAGADASLAGDEWAPTSAFAGPIRHPGRPAPRPSAGTPDAPGPNADVNVADVGAPNAQPPLAPEGWRPSPALPLAHPFTDADLRRTLTAPGPYQPLTYLEPFRPSRPVSLALGGADPTRPQPVSGSIVGGGPPPLPKQRPEPPAFVASPMDEAEAVSHVEEVRAGVRSEGL